MRTPRKHLSNASPDRTARTYERPCLFRCDLRLDDNSAWANATIDHDAVEGVFILDERLLGAVGDLWRALLLDNLRALDEQFRALGGRLTIADGLPEAVIPQSVERHDAVYWNRDYTLFARRRDTRVDEAMRADIRCFDGSVVHAPGTVLTGGRSPYRVFTPFYRKWEETPIW